MSERLKGRKRSHESMAKTAAANRGRKRSYETRQKIREKALARAKCPEYRARLSASMKGRHVSEQARENMRKAQLGKKQPPEVTAKIRAKNLGRKHTEEARAKMSRAQAAKIAAAALKHGVPLEVWDQLPVNARSNWPRLARERGLTVSEFIQTQLHRPCIRALLPQGAAIAPQRTTQGELHLVPA
jgi:hypothetical protein